MSSYQLYYSFIRITATLNLSPQTECLLIGGRNLLYYSSFWIVPFPIDIFLATWLPLANSMITSEKCLHMGSMLFCYWESSLHHRISPSKAPKRWEKRGRDQFFRYPCPSPSTLLATPTDQRSHNWVQMRTITQLSQRIKDKDTATSFAFKLSSGFS